MLHRYTLIEQSCVHDMYHTVESFDERMLMSFPNIAMHKLAT